MDWAKTLGLEVHLATVIHPLDSTAPDAVLDATVGRMEARGVAVHKCALRGTYVPGALADYAESVDADLVAMGSHTRAGAARVALGSVAMGVVGMARCPVLISRTP